MNFNTTSKPDHNEKIIENGQATPRLLAYFDEIEQKLNDHLLGEAVKLPSYAVADLPDAKKYQGHWLYVTDETGGEVPAFSDGTNWRRSTDRAIAS